jgi:hypothetical protein
LESVTALPKSQLTCDVSFEIAVGCWQTVQTTDGRNSFALSSRDGPSFIFGKAISDGKRTALVVTHDILEGDVRLIAVGRDGKEHEPTDFSGGGVKGFRQLEAEFDLPRDEIREFRVQTRPYERIEITDVALPLAVGQ